MSVEHIVADFETCKEAAEIGLNIKSVFTCYGNNCGDRSSALTERPLYQEWLEEFPAPTAEEVPLPTVYMQAATTTTISYVTFNGLGVFWEQQSSEHIELYIDNPNEATARLKMAIWLIKNVPEARQWYVENGYLNEANRDRD